MSSAEARIILRITRAPPVDHPTIEGSSALQPLVHVQRSIPSTPVDTPIITRRSLLAGATGVSGPTVVIDTLRAFTTAAHLLDRGVAHIVLTGTLDEARNRARATPRTLLCGEDGGRRPDDFDLDNSPIESGVYPDLAGRIVVMRTSGVPAPSFGHSDREPTPSTPRASSLPGPRSMHFATSATSPSSHRASVAPRSPMRTRRPAISSRIESSNEPTIRTGSTASAAVLAHGASSRRRGSMRQISTTVSKSIGSISRSAP